MQVSPRTKNKIPLNCGIAIMRHQPASSILKAFESHSGESSACSGPIASKWLHRCQLNTHNMIKVSLDV